MKRYRIMVAQAKGLPMCYASDLAQKSLDSLVASAEQMHTNAEVWVEEDYTIPRQVFKDYQPEDEDHDEY